MWARCDPYDEWDHFLARVRAGGAVPRRFPIDAIRRSDRVEGCDLPDVDPSSIAVTVDDDVLAIRAERAVALEAGGPRARARPGRRRARRRGEPHARRVPRRRRYEAGVLRITIPIATAVGASAVEPARPLGGQPRSGTPGRGVLG